MTLDSRKSQMRRMDQILEISNDKMSLPFGLADSLGCGRKIRKLAYLTESVYL